MELRELRQSLGITQKNAAQLLNISERMYQHYESDDFRRNTMQYKYIFEFLLKQKYNDDEINILTISEIKRKILPILNKHNISYCYLFGSYAREEANPLSDVDLLIEKYDDSFEFLGFIEEIRNVLRKRIDVVCFNKLTKKDLIGTILKEGIKIYER